jgi:hypothetical protein
MFFIDKMRYGLISNYRRSCSKVGERAIIDNQQEYSNRYLYSAIDHTLRCVERYDDKQRKYKTALWL